MSITVGTESLTRSSYFTTRALGLRWTQVVDAAATSEQTNVLLVGADALAAERFCAPGIESQD